MSLFAPIPRWLGLSLSLLIAVVFGSNHIAAIINFEPVAVLFLGWLILDRSTGPTRIFGAFVVVGAVIMIASAKRRGARVGRRVGTRRRSRPRAKSRPRSVRLI